MNSEYTGVYNNLQNAVQDILPRFVCGIHRGEPHMDGFCPTHMASNAEWLFKFQIPHVNAGVTWGPSKKSGADAMMRMFKLWLGDWAATLPRALLAAERKEKQKKKRNEMKQTSTQNTYEHTPYLGSSMRS